MFHELLVNTPGLEDGAPVLPELRRHAVGQDLALPTQNRVHRPRTTRRKFKQKSRVLLPTVGSPHLAAVAEALARLPELVERVVTGEIRGMGPA